MPETTVSPGKLALSLGLLLVYPVIVLGLAGDWRWWAGWLFALWIVALSAITTVYLYRHDPALLAERWQRPGAAGQQAWDVHLVYAIALWWLLWLVVMPLDAKRYGWSPTFPLWVQALGAVCLLGAAFFLFRAFADNTFLSPLVRLQAERRHRVVDTGVYAIVRHPMYLGADLMMVGAPLMLGSVWALVIGLVFVGILAGRILGEEAMLTAELPGYAAYKAKVRYRLVPYLW